MDASPYGASTFAAGEKTYGPLFTFTTPTVDDIPNYLPTTRGPAFMLWRHYKPRTRGVNVFVLTDGSVVQDTATPDNLNSGVPLPWILNDPDNVFSYVTNWDGTVDITTLNPHVDHVYEGGHVHTINQEEAVFLSAAGYASYISPL